jgi:hypothetical protein
MDVPELAAWLKANSIESKCIKNGWAGCVGGAAAQVHNMDFYF